MDTASHNITVTQNEAPSLQTDYREEPGTEKRIARKQHKDNARTLSKRQQEDSKRQQEDSKRTTNRNLAPTSCLIRSIARYSLQPSACSKVFCNNTE